MAYNDELGTVLDKLSRTDLIYFATTILKIDKNEISNWGYNIIKRKCSKELRMAGGHSFCNLWRDDHELDYEEIVRDVADKVKVKHNYKDDVLIIERKIIDEQIKELWKNSDDNEKERITELVKKEVIKKGYQSAVTAKITRKTVNSVIKKGITREAAFLAFDVGAVTSTVGSLLGYNVIQTILLQTIYRYFGIWTAGEAVLGIGAAGIAINVARFAGPIALALTSAYTVHQIAGPAYRKTIPAVMWIAQKRLELFN